MKKVLFGSLSYDSQSEYVKFLEELDQPKAVAMLVAAAAYAQSRGVYTLEESEVIIKSIRALVPEATLEKTMQTSENDSGN